MKISVTFLKSNYDFYKTMDLIEASSADFIHVDVMDGLAVNNHTIFTKEMLAYLKKCKKAKEVHLMTLHLKKYIDIFASIKPEYIIYEFETITNHEEIISYIKSKGIKVGVAINPFTDIKAIEPYIYDYDQILVMSVIPGYGGQKFISNTTDRIKKIIELRKNKKANFLINVDGGISEETIDKVKQVDIATSGSYICMNNDYDKQINKLKASKK